MFQSLVDGQPIRAVVASDGRAAIEAIDANGPPILILTDLDLTKLDGFKMMETLRAAGRWSCDRGLGVHADAHDRAEG